MKITPFIDKFDTCYNFRSRKTARNRVFENRAENIAKHFVINDYSYEITNGFENYNTAQKLFRKNLQDGKGIFGNPENSELLIQNDKIKRNVVKFFAQYSQEELDKLDSKKILTMDEVRYRNDLKEVRDFFSEYDSSWAEHEQYFKSKRPVYTKNIAFAGNMTRKDEGYCKNIVHVYSVACGAVSAALGEGAAVGADTLPLRVLQFAMFTTMAAYLNVPPIPSLEYYTKEMFAGATLGVGGAKLVTSWLGIGGHIASGATGTSVVTGGGSNAAITGGVRAVNATLSTFITEKMGRGYINRVKNNRMNFRDQTIETAAYFVGRGLLTSDNPFKDMMSVDFKDASSPDLIKGALERIPAKSQEAIVTALDLAKEFSNRAGTMFTINFVVDLFSSKETDPEKIVKRAQAIFKQSLITAAVYQLCDITVEKNITREATETIKDIQENLDKYPEVYHAIINAEHEFFEKVNIDTLSAEAFTRQFKNKTFVHNLSIFSNSMLNEVSIAIVNRNRAKQARKIYDAQKSINQENQKRKETESMLSPEEQAEVQRQVKELEAIMQSQKEFYKSEKGFGYGRIAGYENIKSDLTLKFIQPVSTKDTDLASKIPNAILFFGPTGVGKSELTRALAEQAKCLMPRFKDPENAQELHNKLDFIVEKAKNGKRHSVLIIDEFDDCGSDPEEAKIFADFIKDCAQNNITLLLTTNNPLDIDKSILSQTINIPIGIPSKKDVSEVLKFYLENLEQGECDEIADTIIKKSQNSAFSNSQIKSMCIKAMRLDSTNLKDRMIQLIKSTSPEITKKELDKFNNEIKELEGI